MPLVIIPDFEISGVRRRGRTYFDTTDLVAWLYKAASEEGQDEAAALAFKGLAEMIEEAAKGAK